MALHRKWYFTACLSLGQSDYLTLLLILLSLLLLLSSKCSPYFCIYRYPFVNFFLSAVYLFSLLEVIYCLNRSFNLNKVQLISFSFMNQDFGVTSKMSPPYSWSFNYFPIFFIRVNWTKWKQIKMLPFTQIRWNYLQEYKTKNFNFECCKIPGIKNYQTK